MKKVISILICAVLLLSLAACSQSVSDKVKIESVEEESFRPEGYQITGDLAEDGFNWAGVVISGDITNISNETLSNIVVVINCHGENNAKSRNFETAPLSLQPGETKKFSYRFVYDDQTDVRRPFPWYHEIKDVVQK